MKKSLLKLSTISLILFSPFVQATEIIEVNDNGIYFEIDNDTGEFIRIRTVGEADLEIGDRQDIRIATQKATLRAKTEIAKFLEQRISTSETLDNMVNTITTTTGQNKEVVRESVETIVTNIKNSSEAILKGVIILKTDVNKDEKYVSVEVGTSRKTMKAADSLNESLKTESSEATSPSNKEDAKKIDAGSGREIKKSKNYDDF